MCKVQMIRLEPGLIAIPVESAVYCPGCEHVSNSAWDRCGLCGSDGISEIATVLIGPLDPDPTPTAVVPGRNHMAA